ncbi:MAG TPA: DUF4129 domain-containing protein [Blastocatellia bacterium]|nr:DUF4129 domain-containing protein [Blastocatellia bacterium]
MRRSLLISIAAALLLAASSYAASLRNYENRVKWATEQIDRVKVDPEYSEEGVEAIKGRIPRTEKIDHEGKTTVVDNTWLYESLDSYAGELDPQQKVAKLNEIGGRLRALDEQLVRADEMAASKAEQTEARRKIDNILDRPEYRAKQESRIGAFVKEIWRKVGNFLGRLYAAFLRLLRSIFGATTSNNWLAKVLVIAALVAAAIGIVRAARQMKPRKRRGRKRTVLGEEIEAGTSPRDLAEAAMAAARAGDFRNAIRKLYVSLLYDLAERNVIELDDSATNREYLAKLSSFNSLMPPMKYLTDRFDYCWYGMLPSSEEDFSQYFARYNEAMERARSLSPQAAP